MTLTRAALVAGRLDAEVRYEVGGRVWRQPFTADRLTELSWSRFSRRRGSSSTDGSTGSEGGCSRARAEWRVRWPG